jgi:Cu2+-exporting ATPase
VAQAIVASGLDDYYRHRDALPDSPREALPQAAKELGLFDHPRIQAGFVEDVGEHEHEAALILEGITCAACVWLNEAHLGRQPGVTAVNINYATRRARVRWDDRVTRLSAILEAVVAIGYRAHPYDTAKLELLAQQERRAALWRLFVAGFGMMQVMMYAVPVYLAGDGEMTAEIELLMRWASLVLTLPVMLYSAAPFFSGALRDLRLRRIGMDVPVALGVGSAFIASVWATVSASGEVYFDSVTMFVFLLLGGRYLEMMARQRAARGVEAISLALPAIAERLNGPERTAERVAVADLAVGDLVRVRPGEAMPADALVVEGETSVDESLLTGESMPVPKRLGDPVTGGSVNVGSPLVLRVERVGEATRLASIRRLMERAQSDKPQLVLTADRIASRFVAALLVLAVLTWMYWMSVDPSRALWVFVAVLVVSCPCALSLATPVALTVATGALARCGVLVTRSHAIETLARITHIVFDKTGTLTEGRPVLLQTHVLGSLDEQAALQLAAALEAGSEHPLGRALFQAAGSLPLPELTHLRAITGRGIEALHADRQLRIGSLSFVAELHGQAPPALAREWSSAGNIVVALGCAEGWIAIFRLADAPRASAMEALQRLRSMGIAISLLSGDASATVAGTARALGIDNQEGELSPEAKHDRIARLQAGGGVIAMVGDGVNDAPVLALAHVSIAMGGGTDLARSQADVVLLADDLVRLAEGIDVARNGLRVIRQNLIWAFAYNFIAIPLAMVGWVTPWMAGIGMSASSLGVVLNALRLQAKKTG